MNDCEDCSHRQHENKCEAPSRHADEKSAPCEKDEEHGPYKFEWAIHSQHVAEQEEMSNGKERCYAQHAIEATQQYRHKNGQDHYTHIDLGNAESGAEIRFSLHW